MAAGDQADNLAGFSNYGQETVDLMAPGVRIKSTIVGGKYTEAYLMVEASGNTSNYDAIGMAFAGTTPQDGTSGVLYDCGKGYRDQSRDQFPSGVAGNVALIERGKDEGAPDFFFSEKVTNAQDAGAIAAVIYNNQPGNFSGTLGSPSSWIPVVSISKSDGSAILSNIDQLPTATIFSRTSDTLLFYSNLDGTSMAAPFVAGVAGLLLAEDPTLEYGEVKSILLNTVDKLTVLDGVTSSGGRLNAFSALRSILSSVLPGDVSCDQTIALDDALIALQISTGFPAAPAANCLPWDMDANGDERIGIADVIYILNHISGLKQ